MFRARRNGRRKLLDIKFSLPPDERREFARVGSLKYWKMVRDGELIRTWHELPICDRDYIPIKREWREIRLQVQAWGAKRKRIFPDFWCAGVLDPDPEVARRMKQKQIRIREKLEAYRKAAKAEALAKAGKTE